MSGLKSKRVRICLVHLLPLLLSLVIGAIIAYFAGQDQNWDLFNYHFYNPYALLHHREYMDFAPAGMQTFFNPLMDIIPYLLIVSFKPVLVGLSLGAIQGLNLWIVYEICLLMLRSYIKHWSLYVFAFFIAIASFMGAGNLSEIGATMGDNISSIFVLAGLLLYLISYLNKDRKYSKWIKAGGFVLVGAATGLKLTNAPYAIGLFALELIYSRGFLTILKRTLINGFWAFIGLLISYGYWGYYLYSRFKSPLFPNFNSIFKSPYYPYINFHDSRFFPHGLLQTIFYPFYFTVKQKLTAEVVYRDARLAVLYAAILILALIAFGLILARKKRLSIPPLTSMLIFFVVVSYVLWESEFSIYRYVIPIEFLSLIGITSIVFILIRYNRIAISIVVITIISFTTIPMNWGRTTWKPAFFGIQMPYKIQPNSMLILAGGEPEGFIVPFLPHSVSVISMYSSIDPSNQNLLIKELLHSRINTALKQRRPIYGIESLYNGVNEKYDYLSYGFVFNSCSPINTYNPFKKPVYFLCKLQYINE